MATVTIKATRDGGRRVIVDVPVDQCVSAAPFAGDPVRVADSIAVEVAMHRLGEWLGDR